MSDMSNRAALPPATDHEQHDALLVAQLAAGDALEPERQAEAQRLVASCGACAEMAADLRAVAGAVAHEPVPPRRRDFRLSAQQAEELSGSTLTRFLRRLSLPSTRAFQPAAAGILSIGLLFVVAGYAWPDGGAITVEADPNFAVYGTPAPALDPGGAPAPAVVESDADDVAGADDVAAADDAAGADGLGAAEPDAEFFETLPESQAGTADRLNQKSLASEESLAGGAEEPEAAAPERAADSLEAAAEAPPAPAEERRSAADTLEAPAEAPVTGQDAAALAPEPKAEGEAVVDEVIASEVVAVSDDDGGPEDLLLVLGVVLAVTGAGLLLLGWLARRSRDPLLP